MIHGLWYALKVRSRFEWVAATNLRNKGYEVFLPTYRCKRRWSDRIKTVEFPLFSGYLFCHFDIQNRMPILMATGVQSVVGRGKIPEPIEEAELSCIRTVLQSGMAYLPHPYLGTGDLVRITKGSLFGLTGIVIQIKDSFRLVISVSLLM